MPEIGFIPPVARKKLLNRERLRLRNLRQSRLTFVALCLAIVCFVGNNVLYIRAVKKVVHNNDSVVAHGGSQMIRPLSPGSLRGAWISKDSQPFNEGKSASRSHHLIMVAGHSVTVSGHLEDAGEDETDWFLLDYQQGQGLPEAIKAHIQAGIDAANKDPDSLLVFSGGETRAVTGPLTEGASYFHVADAMKLWPAGSTVRARTVTEEFATDSFENFMFSICRFKEVTGHYPTKISIVSFTFKQRRFESLHAPALGWPKDNLVYIGVDPPVSTGFDLQRASEGEWKNAAAPFEKDPYGCHSEVLQQKRKDRNPFSRTAPYPLSCPEMKELLRFCGPDIFPKSRLPWGER